MNLAYFVVLSCFSTLIASHKYTCVFDQLYKDYHPHHDQTKKKDQPTTYHFHGRELAVLSRTPIRITLDTSDFDTIKSGLNGAASTTAAHLQYIKRSMQVTQAFFQARLQVTQVTRIYSPANCFDFSTPENDRTNGIASSDLHIYVRYLTDKGIAYGATGVSCAVFTVAGTAPDSTFQRGRPTIGRIIFNTYSILQNEGITNDQALLTNRRFSSITATAIHETTHILGFNSNLYTTYLNPNSLDGSEYVTYLSASAKLHSSRTHPTVLLTTPHVTKWAQDFFNCSSITGMQLQNEDATIPGSHWERAIMYDQLMTGTQLGAQKGISGATFALLKDMGWYDVDDRFYDYTNFGYQKGCSFYTDVCYSATSLPKYFCNANTQSSISQCATNFLGKSVCTAQSSLMSDGCGMWASYHNCVDPNQGDDGFKQFTLQQYRTDAFCITSTLGTSSISQQSKSRCYPYTCTYAPQTQSIKFQIGTYSVNCLKTDAGTKKTISALAGYLQCPIFDDYCTNSRKICKNWCSQNGICTRGICNCYTGFSGQDCSKTICTSTQFYNPASNTCGDSCPSGTYQNKYSKTCLPCDAKCAQCMNQPTQCSACHSTIDNPQVFYKGLCYNACPKGTYKINDACYDCASTTSHCSSCEKTATNCTSCTTSYILNNPVFGVCGTACTDNTYPLQDRVNWKCVDTCKDNLILSADNLIGICILCPLNQFKWISDSKCHPDCDQGFYKDTEQRFCKQCHKSCLYCDGSFAENCTKCPSNSTSKYLLLKMCISSCPSGYYANDTSGACQVCTVTLNCASCYVNNVSNKIECYNCKYGYYIQANHTCLSGCDIYFYQNKWNHSCDQCSASCGDCSSPYESSCINCRANKFYLSNQTGGYCLDDCPATYYVKTGSNCLSCHKTCKTCNGITSSSCHSCVDGLYLYSGYCRYVCPQKTFSNKNSLACDSCNQKCKFCFGSTVDNCTSCQTGLVLNNFTCTTGCPKGMIVNTWNVCQKYGLTIKFSLYFICLSILIILTN